MLVVLLLLAATRVEAQEVAAQARASATEVTVGQPFTVEVTATGPRGTSWSFPAKVDQGPVELTATAAGAAVAPGTQRYAAMAVGLDPLQVPPLKIGYRLPDGREGTVETAAVPLKLVSLLPRDKQQQRLEDVRPPIDLAIGRAFWIAVAIAGALLGVLVVWLWRRRKPAVVPEAPPAPPATPPEEAFAALDELAASGLLARDPRGFYIRLAEIAKLYLERRLGAPVLEMTSSEAVVFVQDRPDATVVAPVLRDLTGAADLVKFARAGTAEEEARRHLLSARKLVETLEERLQPRTQGPSEP